MNKELLFEQITEIEGLNLGIRIIPPGNLTTQDTANNLVELLQTMYVGHGITKNVDKLVDDINAGNVLTWFAKKADEFVATASLVRQDNGAWELGRAVSLDRGNGIGKRVILEALRFHIENHSTSAMVAEVRAASEFKGIPSGQATQKIVFGLISNILPIRPFAVAPLFAHGKPLRNEQFILSASDVPAGKTISQRISESLSGRSTNGTISRLQVIQTSPFRLAVPDDSGKRASVIAANSEGFKGCTLFPVEATDKNMPLIGMLSANPNMVVCGIDRLPGREGKPVILIATLGFKGNIKDGSISELAPTEIGEMLPKEIREDIQKIADKFTNIHTKKSDDFRKERDRFWKAEMNWPKDEGIWEG